VTCGAEEASTVISAGVPVPEHVVVPPGSATVFSTEPELPSVRLTASPQTVEKVSPARSIPVVPAAETPPPSKRSSASVMFRAPATLLKPGPDGWLTVRRVSETPEEDPSTAITGVVPSTRVLCTRATR
jgi:hypothetical protein